MLVLIIFDYSMQRQNEIYHMITHVIQYKQSRNKQHTGYHRGLNYRLQTRIKDDFACSV